MASSYKPAKTELIAIYRLEFYKNKKNWKLCQDVRKEPPKPDSQKIQHLNETYNVEPDLETEQISPHNKAFCHEVSCDCNNLNDIQPPQDPAPAQDLQACHTSWTDQHQPLAGDKADAVWQDAEQEWCADEAEGVPEQIAYPDQCDGLCHQQMWRPVNEYEELTPQSEPIEQPIDYFSPAELLQMTEEWLQSNGYPVCQEEYAPYYEQYSLLDDSTDFVRGAHRVPHSSETDLSIPHDDCACLLSRSLCKLSGRQLACAMHRHATALRHLLIEHTIRDQLFAQTPLPQPQPFEDYPTRDTDPLHTPDCLLASSHVPKAGTGVGRGRGRLRQEERVIGIGMGRPYRV